MSDSRGQDREREITDAINRPGEASADATYAEAGSIAEEGFETGRYARAGVGRASAAWSVFSAEAKGPNAGAEVKASDEGVKAFAGAELASASASAGPVKATVGLSAETGVGVGKDGMEAKVLGTGISIGRKLGVSVFGTGFEIKLW